MVFAEFYFRISKKKKKNCKRIKRPGGIEPHLFDLQSKCNTFYNKSQLVIYLHRFL